MEKQELEVVREARSYVLTLKGIFSKAGSNPVAITILEEEIVELDKVIKKYEPKPFGQRVLKWAIQTTIEVIMIFLTLWAMHLLGIIKITA